MGAIRLLQGAVLKSQTSFGKWKIKTGKYLVSKITNFTNSKITN